MILNPKSPNADVQLKDAQAAGHAMGQRIHIFNASTENEIDATFATVARQKPDALLVGTDPFFTSQRDRLVALAARNRIPAGGAEGRWFVSHSKIKEKRLNIKGSIDK